MENYLRFTFILLISTLLISSVFLSGCKPKQTSPAASYTATDKPTATYDDGYFAVYKITDNIFGIAEPLYFEGNFSYLVIGNDKALMIDATAATDRNVLPVLKTLTDKPIAVMPTHMHRDHIGGLPNFEEIWLADLPIIATFKQADGKYFVPASYSLSSFDGSTDNDIPPVTVSRLIAPDSIIDLGGVKLKVLLTPGHSQDELVFYDEVNNILFAGDYIYPSFLLNGNVAEYAASTDLLLSVINEQTLVLGAHAGENRYLIPVQRQSDLLVLKDFLDKLQKGEVSGEEIDDEEFDILSAMYYEIGNRMSLLDEIVWTNNAKFNY